jgi:hypothetical protein
LANKRAITAVFLLSFGVWLFFYIAMPRAPLTAPEIAIVVAVCGGVVLAAQRVIARFGKKAPTHDTPVPDTKPPASDLDNRKG